MAITVLRLGHRPSRDKRISTHVGLVARAMGCSRLVYSGQHDKSLEDSIEKVVKQWGGDFTIEYVRDWKGFLRDWKGKAAHLTVYGLPFQKEISKLRKSKKPLLIVVGGEKVPPEVYQTATWNLSVTNQPHSEVGALSIFMHEYFRGRELEKRFPGARKRVIPQERGKRLVQQGSENKYTGTK